MKKVGILVDDYKLPIFRKNLKEAGFVFEEKTDSSIPENVSALFVQTDDVDALQGIVKKSNVEAKRNRRKRRKK